MAKPMNVAFAVNVAIVVLAIAAVAVVTLVQNLEIDEADDRIAQSLKVSLD